MTAGEQIAVLLAVARGLMDAVPVERVVEAEAALLEKVKAEFPDLDDAIDRAEKDDPLWKQLTSSMEVALAPFRVTKEDHADTGIPEPKDQDRPGPAGGGQDNEKPGGGKHPAV